VALLPSLLAPQASHPDEHTHVIEGAEKKGIALGRVLAQHLARALDRAVHYLLIGAAEGIRPLAECPQPKRPLEFGIRFAQLTHAHVPATVLQNLPTCGQATLGVWFLLHRGQFHGGPLPAASAAPSTGVLPVR
jgi:hypothetical protein